MVPHLVINATSLFFHNRRSETPATKKNLANRVEEWAQGLPPPPSKRQRTSVAGTSHSASSKANPIPVKTSTRTTTAITKSTSHDIIVGSTTGVLTGRKKLSPGTKRRAEDLESASEADNQGTASNLRYRGLSEDEDDTLEQADAVSCPVKALVAAQMSKVSPWRVFRFPITLLLIGISLSKESLYIRQGITVAVQETKLLKRQGNGQLPRGALEHGRWTNVFVPTFLRYVGGTSKDIWALKLQDAITALQAIWNEVYKGSTKDHQNKLKHLVEPGGAVHDVVRRFMMLRVLLTISANYSQSIQRLTEWRSSVGSNGLVVVGDFMDSLHLETTEEWQEVAEQLLNYNRYIYLKTRDTEEDGELSVRKGTISIPTYPLKVIQVRRSGRYRGGLVIQTLAQCWIDFDGTVDVTGFVDHDHFPYAALVLSATSVRFPLRITLNIFMIYRCIVLCVCGPRDTSPRRAMTTPS